MEWPRVVGFVKAEGGLKDIHKASAKGAAIVFFVLFRFECFLRSESGATCGKMDYGP